MSTLTNMNKCDTFHASMYLFRSLWHYFVAKKKIHVHLPVISIVGEIYSLQRNLFSSEKFILFREAPEYTFKNRIHFKNRIRHGERIQNNLFDWELPPPPPEKSSIYSTNCFEVISYTFSFLSVENQKNARRV